MEDNTSHTNNEQEHQSETVSTGGNGPASGTRSVLARLKLIEIVNISLTAILAATTIYYARLTAKSLQVSANMALLMKQANEINFRPYVQLEGVQATRIEQMAARSALDAKLLKNTKAGAYLISQSADGTEYIQYSARNLGQVPAHDVRYFVEVYNIDKQDHVEHLLPAQDEMTISETLFPNQPSDRQMELGKGVIIRNDQEIKKIKVKLRIEYSGNRDIDPNRYFYSITLVYDPAPSLEALSGIRIVIEETDEGIVHAPAGGQ